MGEGDLVDLEKDLPLGPDGWAGCFDAGLGERYLISHVTGAQVVSLSAPNTWTGPSFTMTTDGAGNWSASDPTPPYLFETTAWDGNGSRLFTTIIGENPGTVTRADPYCGRLYCTGSDWFFELTPPLSSPITIGPLVFNPSTGRLTGTNVDEEVSVDVAHPCPPSSSSVSSYSSSVSSYSSSVSSYSSSVSSYSSSVSSSSSSIGVCCPEGSEPSISTTITVGSHEYTGVLETDGNSWDGSLTSPAEECAHCSPTNQAARSFTMDLSGWTNSPTGLDTVGGGVPCPTAPETFNDIGVITLVQVEGEPCKYRWTDGTRIVELETTEFGTTFFLDGDGVGGDLGCGYMWNVIPFSCCTGGTASHAGTISGWYGVGAVVPLPVITPADRGTCGGFTASIYCENGNWFAIITLDETDTVVSLTENMAGRLIGTSGDISIDSEHPCPSHGSESFTGEEGGTDTFTARVTGNHTIRVWGAGGSGSGAIPGGPPYVNGAGGGGGAYSSSVLYLTAGVSYTVVWGQPGYYPLASDGGDSYFATSTTVMAKGGSGVPENGTTGALGGQASSGFGTTKHDGGAGADGGEGVEAGGGASAGHSGNGGDASGGTGGTAPTGGGNGGNFDLPGANPGGGSGGAFGIPSDGGPGKVTVEW